jgi:general secretion pathway protein A
VDEAQNLSIDAIEELRMLSNFQLGAQPLLQTLLLGQPEFRDTIASPDLEQLRQRVIASHHLDAMEADEIQPYVEHRLALVGWTGRPSIAADVYAALYKASGGVPRRINQIAARLFLMAGVEKAEHIDLVLFERVLAEVEVDTGLAPGKPLEEGAQPRRSLRMAPAAPVDAVPFAEMKAAFDERDALISELQQAVIELANAVETAPAPAVPVAAITAAPDPSLKADLAALARRLDAMEGRLAEQETSVKHTLAMMIDWLENDQKAAA